MLELCIGNGKQLIITDCGVVETNDKALLNANEYNIENENKENEKVE